MALLRQCLQELRLRRGDVELLLERPSTLSACGMISVSTSVGHGDDEATDGIRKRTGSRTTSTLAADVPMKTRL
jgi:hypothetical protein